MTYALFFTWPFMIFQIYVENEDVWQKRNSTNSSMSWEPAILLTFPQSPIKFKFLTYPLFIIHSHNFLGPRELSLNAKEQLLDSKAHILSYWQSVLIGRECFLVQSKCFCRNRECFLVNTEYFIIVMEFSLGLRSVPVVLASISWP